MCFYRLNKINEQQVPNLGRSLIDFFSETVAIDLKTSVLYESEEEMLSKSKK